MRKLITIILVSLFLFGTILIGCNDTTVNYHQEVTSGATETPAPGDAAQYDIVLNNYDDGYQIVADTVTSGSGSFTDLDVSGSATIVTYQTLPISYDALVVASDAGQGWPTTTSTATGVPVWVCDGGGDDNVEIQAAIDQLGSGHTIQLSSGSFTASNIHPETTVGGGESITVQGVGKATKITWLSSNTWNQTNIFTITSGSGIAVQDMTLDGNRTSNTTTYAREYIGPADPYERYGNAIFVYANTSGTITNIEISGLYVYSTLNSGINIHGNGSTWIYGVNVHDNIVEYAGWHGIQLWESVRNYTVTSNIVKYTFSVGIIAELTGDTNYGVISGNTVKANIPVVRTGGTKAIAVQGSDSVSIFGNSVQGSISLSTAKYCNISGNTVLSADDNRANFINSGITLEVNSDYNTVAANTVQFGAYRAIVLDASDHNTIASNNITEYDSSPDNTGIRLNNSDFNDIYGNHITDGVTGTFDRGIRLTNTSNSNYVHDNYLGTLSGVIDADEGAVYDQASDNRVENNYGWTTENWGTDSFSASTSDVINFTFSDTPTVFIPVWTTSNTPSQFSWSAVHVAGSTTATVTVTCQTATSDSYSWEALAR